MDWTISVSIKKHLNKMSMISLIAKFRIYKLLANRDNVKTILQKSAREEAIRYSRLHDTKSQMNWLNDRIRSLNLNEAW